MTWILSFLVLFRSVDVGPDLVLSRSSCTGGRISLVRTVSEVSIRPRQAPGLTSIRSCTLTTGFDNMWVPHQLAAWWCTC